MANRGPVGHLSPPWDTMSPRPRAPGRGRGLKASQPFWFLQQRHFPLQESQAPRERAGVSAPPTSARSLPSSSFTSNICVFRLFANNTMKTPFPTPPPKQKGDCDAVHLHV